MALFYNLKTAGDVLYIINEPSSYPDEVKESGDVVSLYKEGRLVGINILRLSKKVKIFANGLIAAPDNALIDLINNVLVNAGAEKIPYVTSSGYKVAKVTALEEHPLNEKLQIVTLSLGNETISSVTRYSNMNVGDNIVVAVDNCIKFDGTQFKKRVERNIPIDCELCSESDLRLGDDYKSVLIVNDLEAGSDFFVR